MKNETREFIKDRLEYILHVLVEALFPTRCQICEGFFPPPFRPNTWELFRERFPDLPPLDQMLASHVCPECPREITRVESPICPKCGVMCPTRDGADRLCKRCLTRPMRFGKARAFGVHEGTLGTLIHRMKYRERLKMARLLEHLLFSAFIHHWDVHGIDILMPVPLHDRRSRKRGFNQAWMMFLHWHLIAEGVGVDLSHIRLERDVLFRTRHTRPQVGMDREERQENLRGAFTVRRAEKIRGRRILLVDDVFTTGSTADECAKALLENGAARMDVITLAQAVRGKTDI